MREEDLGHFQTTYFSLHNTNSKIKITSVLLFESSKRECIAELHEIKYGFLQFGKLVLLTRRMSMRKSTLVLSLTDENSGCSWKVMF